MGIIATPRRTTNPAYNLPFPQRAVKPKKRPLTRMLVNEHVNKQFILAGAAIFTIEEPDGTHHTFRVDKTESNERFPNPAWFVKYLSGPDNESDYTYLGKLDDFTGQTATTAKSAALKDCFKLRLLNRVLARIWADDHAAYEQHGYRTHHEGRCGRCGRTLTVPSSITSGIGPECAKVMSRDAVREHAEMKNAFAQQEAEQERQAYLNNPV